MVGRGLGDYCVCCLSHAFNLKSWAEASSSCRSLIPPHSIPAPGYPPSFLRRLMVAVGTRLRSLTSVGENSDYSTQVIFEISHRIRAALSKRTVEREFKCNAPNINGV